MTAHHQEPTTRPLISLAKVARQARVGTAATESLILQGVLPQPVIRSGRIIRFDPDAIDRALSGDAK